jgi:hypothetical protein
MKLQLASYAIGQHFLMVAPGTTPSHVAAPDFWVHQAAKLKPFDRIEVVAADGSFDAELRVVAVDPRGLWAQVRVLRICTGEGVPLVSGKTVADVAVGSGPDKDGYLIEWGGPQRWRIIRGADPVAHGFPDEASAAAALAEIKAAKPAKKAAA